MLACPGLLDFHKALLYVSLFTGEDIARWFTRDFAENRPDGSKDQNLLSIESTTCLFERR